MIHGTNDFAAEAADQVRRQYGFAPAVFAGIQIMLDYQALDLGRVYVDLDPEANDFGLAQVSLAQVRRDLADWEAFYRAEAAWENEYLEPPEVRREWR